MSSFASFLRLFKRSRGYPLCCESSRSIHALGAVVLIVFLGLANFAADLAFVNHAKQMAALRDPPLSSYSFIEDDYPPRLPLPLARTAGVRLTLSESARYDPSHPESAFEWASASAAGDTNIRLGPSHRFFNPAFSYELHCLRVVVTALGEDGPLAPGRQRAHVERCLNVLRQFALCDADATVEPVGSLEGNFVVGRFGGERVCKDWPALYGVIEQNWEDWKRFREVVENA
ncbi:hypothetical protein VTO73DRAFT_4053 [Trametes versicolor]